MPFDMSCSLRLCMCINMLILVCLFDILSMSCLTGSLLSVFDVNPVNYRETYSHILVF